MKKLYIALILILLGLNTNAQCGSNPIPVVNFTASDTSACDTLCVAFLDLSSIAAGTIVQWVWDLGDGGPTINSQVFDHCYTNSSFQTTDIFTVSLTVTSDSGCVITKTKNNYISLDNCTGVSELENNFLIQNYPNPFTFQTAIIFNEEQKNSTVKIIDVLGKEIKSITFSGKQLILEKEELKEGIYFLQIINENKKMNTKKIIIQ